MDDSKRIRLPDRTAGLLAAGLSLAVHIVLIFVVARTTIVIHTLPRVFQVQTVVIPASKKISLPPKVDWAELPPPTILDWTFERTGRVSARIRETPAAPEGPSIGSIGGLSETGEVGTYGLYSPDEIFEGFAGHLTSRFTLSSKSDSELTISLTPGKPGVRTGSVGPVGDLRARAGAVGSGTRSETGSAGRGAAGTRRQTRGKASVFISRQTVDMGPWAEAMMTRILSKWTLPEAHQIVRRSQVAISAVIEKSGEISRLDVLSGTSSSFLDIAALEALKLSSPLLRLPEGFPDANLEALFLFTYEN
ncbi:MAG: hypothetical protein SCM96_00660 [Acidobacteriota bacterium]|nr:hypothetical protein [Acidobacteriota bacterium]